MPRILTYRWGNDETLKQSIDMTIFKPVYYVNHYLYIIIIQCICQTGQNQPKRKKMPFYISVNLI